MWPQIHAKEKIQRPEAAEASAESVAPAGGGGGRRYHPPLGGALRVPFGVSSAIVAPHSAFFAGFFTRHRSILALLFLSYVAAFIDRGLVAVAGAPIKHDLGLSDTRFGLLSGTAFVALYCVCGIPLGWLADRTDRRALIALGLLIWSAMTAACAMTSSFGGFFLARVGVGLGEACLFPAAISLLGSVTPPRQMARAVAIFLMGAAVGNVFALLAGGRILERIGLPLIPGLGQIAPWRALFLLASIPGFALAALVFGIREPARAASLVRPWSALRAALRLLVDNQRAYVPLTIATACIITLAQTQAAWVPLFYTRAFRLAPGEAAQTVGLMFLISAPAGQWLGGSLIDYLRVRGVAAAPLLLQAGCSILCIPPAVLFCTAKQLGASEAGYTVFNLLVFAATPAGMTAWQLLTPERSQGLIIALLMAAVTLIGVGVGPVVVGALTDRLVGHEQALGISLLSIIVGAGIGGFIAALAGRGAFAQSLSADSIGGQFGIVELRSGMLGVASSGQSK
jgi:predicted MFS family arabinose efflux permease